MLEMKLINLLPDIFLMMYLILLTIVKINIAKNLNIKWFKMFIPIYSEYSLYKAVKMSRMYAFFPLLIYLTYIPFIQNMTYGIQSITYSVIIINAILVYIRNKKMFKRIYSSKFKFTILGLLYICAPVLAYLISYVMYSDNTNDTSKEEKEEQLDNENIQDVKVKESREEVKELREEVKEKATNTSETKSDHRKVKIYIKKDSKKEAKKAQKTRNKKARLSKLMALFLAFTIGITSLFTQDVHAIDFNELNPNCAHEHTYETFNQAFPCYLGNVVDDDCFTVCEDCGGVLKVEKKVHKSAHGKNTEVKNGVKICTFCGKSANEDVRYVKRDIKIDEIATIEAERHEKSQIIENKSNIIQAINNNRSILNGRKLDKLEIGKDNYSYVTLLGNKNIEYLDGINHIDSSEHCKDGCKTIIASVTQPRNIKEDSIITVYYACPNCTKNNTQQFSGSEYLNSNSKARLKENSVELRAMWDAIEAYEKPQKPVEKPTQKKVVQKKPVVENKPIEEPKIEETTEIQKYDTFIKAVDKLENIWYNQEGLDLAFYTTTEIVVSMVSPQIGIAIDAVDSIVAGIIEAGKQAEAGAPLGKVIAAGVIKAVGRFVFIQASAKLLDKFGDFISNKLFKNKLTKNITESYIEKNNKKLVNITDEDAIVEGITDTTTEVIEKQGRRTWRESEVYVQEKFCKLEDGFEPQKSFINGVEVSYGQKGSSRPDFINFKKRRIEQVKNYDIQTSQKRSGLVSNIEKQYKKDSKNIPNFENMKYTVYVDVKGQNFTEEIKNDILNKLAKRNLDIKIKFIK